MMGSLTSELGVISFAEIDKAAMNVEKTNKRLRDQHITTITRGP
jgi:hypothetical protein